MQSINSVVFKFITTKKYEKLTSSDKKSLYTDMSSEESEKIIKCLKSKKAFLEVNTTTDSWKGIKCLVKTPTGISNALLLKTTENNYILELDKEYYVFDYISATEKFSNKSL